jgi:hypothetical protein
MVIGIINYGGVGSELELKPQKDTLTVTNQGLDRGEKMLPKLAEHKK